VWLTESGDVPWPSQTILLFEPPATFAAGVAALDRLTATPT